MSGAGTNGHGAGGSRSGVRVVLVSDEQIIGRGLKMVLENAGLSVIHVESLERASRLLGARPREVVVWSGEHADPEELVRAQAIKSRHSKVSFCFLAKSADPEGIEALLDSDPKALAFVPRTTSGQVSDLVDAVALLAARRTVMPPKAMMQIVRRAIGSSGRLDSLTACELEVLEYIALGLRNCEIARQLWKSEKTIEKHVGRLFSKLGLDPQADGHLDRRVTAARIFLEEAQACHFVTVEPAEPGDPGEPLRASRLARVGRRVVSPAHGSLTTA